MKRADEPNPALGWRAIRVGLDRPGIMRMQVQALIRGARGPAAADHVPLRRRRRRVRGGARPRPATSWRASAALGHTVPARAQDRRHARDPEPRLRAGPLLPAHRLHLDRRQRPQAVLLRRRPRERAGAPPLRHAVARASSASSSRSSPAAPPHGTPLSFCGEDAGRPIEALALAAIGFRSLSMRPASIGPVKALLRKVDLAGARAVIDAARRAGQRSARPALEAWLRRDGRAALTAASPHSRLEPRDDLRPDAALLLPARRRGGWCTPLGVAFPGPVLGMGLLFAFVARPRPLRPGARRRRRHAAAQPLAALRARGGRRGAAGGADRRQLAGDLRRASSSRRSSRSSSPSTPSALVARRVEARRA